MGILARAIAEEFDRLRRCDSRDSCDFKAKPGRELPQSRHQVARVAGVAESQPSKSEARSNSAQTPSPHEIAERAAIMQHDGGMPRPVADRFAARLATLRRGDELDDELREADRRWLN